jgi:hypothetical protein
VKVSQGSPIAGFRCPYGRRADHVGQVVRKAPILRQDMFWLAPAATCCAEPAHCIRATNGEMAPIIAAGSPSGVISAQMARHGNAKLTNHTPGSTYDSAVRGIERKVRPILRT